MTAVLRVGIIGAGANTRERHIPGLQAMGGVELVAVSNRSRESSARVAEQFGIPLISDNWPDLVAATDIDAVVIGTWPYLHCRTTVAALAAGKHVMCEARMAMNAAEAHQMHAAALQHPHLVAQIVPSPMTLRVDRTIQRRLAEGFLGELLAVEVRAIGNSFLDREAPLHWRQDYDLSGLNIMSLGIWYEALMRWTGESTRVTAMGRTYVKMRRDGDGNRRAARVPEHIDVIADLACGAQAHLQVSAITGLGGGPEVWLFGSEGTLRLADDKLYGGRTGDNSLSEIIIAPEDEGGWRVEEEFVRAVRGEERITHTTFEDGVKYMEFTEAVARSMATGQAVHLPLQLNG